MPVLTRRLLASLSAALLAVPLGAATAGPATAAAAHPVTLAQLESAPVPALCGHPAGRLVKGLLPGIPAGAGKDVLAATTAHHGSNVLAFGDLNGDGVADAAVSVLCTNGGTARAASIQLYTSGATRLGGLSLDTYTHRPTALVAKVSILHRVVAVHWSATERGDAPGTASLDYATQLSLVGHKVVAGHTHSYGEQLVADQLSGDALLGNRKAATALATPKVVSQLLSAAAKQRLGDLYGCQGTPARDHTWGTALDAFTSSSQFPAFLLTNERYCLALSNGDGLWTLIRFKHLGWRHWQADLFLQAKVVA